MKNMVSAPFKTLITDQSQNVSNFSPKMITDIFISCVFPRSAPNIWVFIAQLVEHFSANAQSMGSNPVEALKIFCRLQFAIA